MIDVLTPGVCEMGFKNGPLGPARPCCFPAAEVPFPSGFATF